MREVAASLFGFMRRVLERYGLDTRPHLHGLSLAEVDASRLGERVHWDELALFLNRCAGSLDPAEQEALGELYPYENRYMHLAAQMVRAPQSLYRALAPVTKAALPHLHVQVQSSPDGRVRFEMELPHWYVPCPVFFAATAGELRALTELCGLGRSEVEADVGPWHGRYDVRVPGEASTADGAGAQQGYTDRAVQALAHILRWILSVDVPAGNVDAARLHREHGLSWLEAHVALQLARGEGIARAAVNLGVSPETVQARLEALQGKLPPDAGIRA